jgi:ABC-type polysaccharide/polyol phosphate transport system ATPase subunit
MTKHAISVSDATVWFRPYIDRSPTLRRSIARRRSKETVEVVALDKVSFNVERGEAFGIVGENGAGKSTLLRLLARTMRPNEGEVLINGKTSTLLQLGVGFNPELSGTRNVYLGGLAHGLRKAEIAERYDSIVEYAGLDDAMDRPLKTYSTGMFSRLAFSISMHLEPDILLLDEVLAVGDESFRVKSMGSMRDLLERSGTIVFVSHSLDTVAEFCDRVLWLEGGRVRAIDQADAVVEAYRASSAV